MVTFAKKEDFEEIVCLWVECFGDDKDFNDYFFENVFDINDTLILRKDGKIASMAQMMEFDTSKGKVTYIYGACTANSHRKQGLMATVLEKSFEIGRQKGHKFSILIPQEPWLFGFYSKFGYEKGLTISINAYHANGESDIVASKLEYTDIKSIDCLYKNSINVDFYIERSQKYYQNQIDLYGQGAVKYENLGEIVGYSFGYKKDDKLILDEIMADDIENCLNSHQNVDIIYKTVGENIDLGMIRPLYDDKTQSGYINLMFN